MWYYLPLVLKPKMVNGIHSNACINAIFDEWNMSVKYIFTGLGFYLDFNFERKC